MSDRSWSGEPEPDGGVRRPGWRRSWPRVGVLVLLTYNTWSLADLVNGHPRILNGYLSELSASDQPHNLFFRVGDNMTALVVGALGVRALLDWRRQHRDRPRWWVVAALALLLFAVSTFLDSFFSMDCSPTLSERCRVLEETGRLSTVHYAHTYTSVGAQTGIVASMVAAYFGTRRAGWAAAPWARWLLTLCLTEVASLLVMMGLLVAGAPGLGYPQAVMVAIASVWFAAVGVTLARAAVAPTAVVQPREHVHAA